MSIFFRVYVAPLRCPMVLGMWVRNPPWWTGRDKLSATELC